jgi:hypothetical protein
LIRVDFEIKFSIEQLSKIMKSDVDVATLRKNDKKNQFNPEIFRQ